MHGTGESSLYQTEGKRNVDSTSCTVTCNLVGLISTT